MSLFGSFMSKKPVSPRPNVVEEKEDGDTLLNAEVGETTRKRTKSKSKKNKKETDSTSAASPAIAAEAEESPASSDDEGLAAKGEKELEEEVEVEHVDEDLKPFDADTSLLVFHTGQVYVREDREVVVEKGGHVVIRDLPSTIHPASLNFSSHSDAEASIVEHTFENGADSFSALLAESVGETVSLRLKGDCFVKGKLLRATDAEVVLESEEGSVAVVQRAHIASAEVNHQAFNREPALHCVVETQQEGAHKAQLTYEASGITWSAEYTLVVRPDSEAEFTGWFTLENNSGKTFTNAALALVAAPHTAPASYDYEQSNKKAKNNIVSTLSSFSKRKSTKPRVSTQDTSYLPRPVTLVQGKEKQVRITHATFPIEQINLFRKFFGPYNGGFMGAHSDQNLEGRMAVNKVLRWTNSKTTHHRLGVELAAGSIDVLDSVKGDTFLNLRHQDQLKFARPGQEILLTTGSHSDLQGERRVTELRADAKTRTIRETVQIEIKNAGSAKQEVVVEDVLWRWHSYTVSPCQPKYDDIAKGKQIMTWRVVVPARSAETIRYTVLYSNVPQQ